MQLPIIALAVAFSLPLHPLIFPHAHAQANGLCPFLSLSPSSKLTVTRGLSLHSLLRLLFSCMKEGQAKKWEKKGSACKEIE